mgnify:CR=1
KIKSLLGMEIALSVPQSIQGLLANEDFKKILIQFTGYGGVNSGLKTQSLLKSKLKSLLSEDITTVADWIIKNRAEIDQALGYNKSGKIENAKMSYNDFGQLTSIEYTGTEENGAKEVMKRMLDCHYEDDLEIFIPDESSLKGVLSAIREKYQEFVEKGSSLKEFI